MEKENKIFSGQNIGGQSGAEKAWREWKIRCAAVRCGEMSQAYLRRFGRVHFRAHARRCGSRLPGYAIQGGGEEPSAWHLLETRFLAGSNRQGKAYKEWLFHRSAGLTGKDWLACIEGGASLLMRDVVRESFRREHAQRFDRDMRRGRPGGDGGSLEELLPAVVDPRDAMAAREWEELAAACAAEWYPRLDARSRIAFWARANGLPLTDERVTKWAKASGSMLYAAHAGAVNMIGGWIQQRHAAEPVHARIRLAMLVLDKLVDLIAPNILSEKRAARFFKSL